MTKKLQRLLSPYSHKVSESNLGIFIREVQPERYVSSSKIGIALFVLVTGILSALVWPPLGLGFLIVFILIRFGYYWYHLEQSKKPKVVSLLIGSKEIQLSKGFKAYPILNKDVMDIKVKFFAEYGEREAQLLILDVDGHEHESLILCGKPDDSLAEDANELADQIWSLIKG